ncbi:uncharacterized protein CANTADRAFT_230435 [Suhomyces tanzawaensis NRRL Y-17324]|uniref:Uncharacterized protein n=1 Tax=Suhomyces tanzawaensis NRRL Y-17324 TaxID=984487 RepID=A0A1E4SL68_9ASCO|nr:uncharacterized protein CANTADRAFT_230435 [Suhomyces tanzawaensis NRRL Y-17324]ODV80265.1 hypothetical protein CANTADRAFT_230435 [Suhomyces tanzawaensis NRRL Y-17324]
MDANAASTHISRWTLQVVNFLLQCYTSQYYYRYILKLKITIYKADSILSFNMSGYRLIDGNGCTAIIDHLWMYF